MGQSALSQYLHGKIPLNLIAAAKFSQLLEVTIEQFSPTIATAVREIASATGISLDLALQLGGSGQVTSLLAAEWRLLFLFRELPTGSQDLLVALATQLRQARSDGLCTASNPLVIACAHSGPLVTRQ